MEEKYIDIVPDQPVDETFNHEPRELDVPEFPQGKQHVVTTKVTVADKDGKLYEKEIGVSQGRLSPNPGYGEDGKTIDATKTKYEDGERGTPIEVITDQEGIRVVNEPTNFVGGLKVKGIEITGNTSGGGSDTNFENGTGRESVKQINTDAPNSASGVHSLAIGGNTNASGDTAHAEGTDTVASEWAAHSEGHDTLAAGIVSHAEGNGTQANGSISHSEGSLTKANGEQSHAEGEGTTSNGKNSHAEGLGTESRGVNSHAEGEETIAVGRNSKALGYKTVAVGDNSIAGGSQAEANGTNSIAFGQLNTKADGADSIALLGGRTSAGNAIAIKGQANAPHAMVVGINSTSSGAPSYVFGDYNDTTKESYIFGKNIHLTGTAMTVAIGINLSLNFSYNYNSVAIGTDSTYLLFQNDSINGTIRFNDNGNIIRDYCFGLGFTEFDGHMQWAITMSSSIVLLKELANTLSFGINKTIPNIGFVKSLLKSEYFDVSLSSGDTLDDDSFAVLECNLPIRFNGYLFQFSNDDGTNYQYYNVSLSNGNIHYNVITVNKTTKVATFNTADLNVN